MSTPDDAPSRLRLARERAGHRSATRAAEALGVVVTTYRTHENGDRTISAECALRYAEAFGVSPAWILYGTEAPSPARRIPVSGMVVSGAEVQMRTTDMQTVEAPPGLSRNAIALRVQGDALYPRYSDGDVLIYESRVGYEDAVGRECIVKIHGSGEILVRRVGPVARGGEVVLEAPNAAPLTRRVDWYSPVAWVRPG